MFTIKFVRAILATIIIYPTLSFSKNVLEAPLSYENTFTIAGMARKQLCRHLDSMELNSPRMNELLNNRDVRNLCYLSQFFSMLSKEKAAHIIELRDPKFKKWLLEQESFFKDYVDCGYVRKRSLTLFYAIWKQMEGKMDKNIMHLAMGASLLSESINQEEIIAKFHFYHQSLLNKRCYPQANELKPWEWAIVLQGGESIDDLQWAQNFIETKEIKPEQAGGVFCSFIPYRMHNRNGISIHSGGAFYDHKPITLQLYTEYGGVCGAVSKGAAGFLRAKGVPAYPIGQPRHCAFIWKHPNGKWKIGNNIGGWNWANGGTKLPWEGPVQIITALENFNSKPFSDESMLLYYFSLFSQKKDYAEMFLNIALKRNSYNYPAWLRYLQINAKNVGDQNKLDHLKKLSQGMPTEHNLIYHVATNILNINQSKINAYELYACLVEDDTTRDQEELVTRLFWNKLIKEVPELAKTGTYQSGITQGFLKLWLKKAKDIKWSAKMKTKTAQAFQQIIPLLQGKNQIFHHFCTSYASFIVLWNDKKQIQDAEKFIINLVKLSKNDQCVTVCNEMSDMINKIIKK